ncbi:tumor necrosis factor receptor type 1-associated DEATH domain protein [Pyxicephalus adspersus]|uniref:Tumor necrosis factor receptor type 1-associated DEATH domain protein n=1 Tax=Pyxicephalus adspersus TaxID=30357 RepID=A0AAV2ZYE1_PYXAD|nr:TPA: hypothetical protein GDO54_002518 [Pyxicephalus adspersus]
MASIPNEWIGSVYLFMHSDSTSLGLKYETEKLLIYKTLRDALSAFSRNSPDSLEILKVLKSDPHLILHLKFHGEDNCLRFLQDYRNRKVHQYIQEQLSRCLDMESLQVFLELKVDNEKLDVILDEEEKCLNHIFLFKPTYVKDEDLVQLERNFTNLSLESKYPTQNNTSPTFPLGDSTQGSLPLPLQSFPEPSTFHFQEQIYADKPLTSEHQQRFATLVGKSWKKVGRSLKKNCRALEDPVIDNLAFEFDKDGLYEQAYQLLRRFIDGEGKKATLKRLVDALVECELNVIAEKLLAVEEK